MPKTVEGKFSSSELKIEKVKLFTQSLTKFYCISVFNVGGCLASCLTFRPFLTLNPEQLGCLLKKTFTPKKTSRVLTFFSSVFGLYLLVRFFQPAVNKVKK